MSGLKVFFGAYKYLTGCLRDSFKALKKESIENVFNALIDAREHQKMIVVDGQGRSLRSILLVEDCLEHNGFPIILPTNNASLRPWAEGDVFIFNSGSGSGTTYEHAKAAKADGLKVLGMTYNEALREEFPDVLVLVSSKQENKLFAPLGTEFELTSAVIGSVLGYSVGESVDSSLVAFQDAMDRILALFDETYSYFEENLEPLMNFIALVSEYIPVENKNKVYFRGVGRDAIINQVAAIRYGHLRKMPEKDLRVIYEGHWDLRRQGDLAIVTSGSGSTSQTLDYAMQGFIAGMRIFGITSFEDSNLGRFCKRVDGCLVIPGRQDPFSMYNFIPQQRKNYLPKFELNCYITLDSLLAQLASNEGITEADMRASHRLKALE